MRHLIVVLLLVGCATSKKAPLLIPGPQGELHVDDGGTGVGIPVVLVHGNGANLGQWRAQLDHLRKSRRAVALDLRGMGFSQVPANGDYSVAGMADDVHAVVEALRIPRFVLIGHSYGGAVVAAYASKHPARVAGIVFADSAGDVKVSEEEAERLLEAIRVDKMRVVKQWYAPILQNAAVQTAVAVLGSVEYTPTEAFVAALDGARRFRMAEALQTYGGPKIAIVAAGNDNPSAFHVQFPSVPARRMERVSHWLMMDRPEEFNRIVDEFLATLD